MTMFSQRLEREKKIFDNLTTFDELCLYNIDFCQDKYKYSACYFADENDSGPNLFEHTEENNLKEYIIQLNKLGFLTDCSQPCDIHILFPKKNMYLYQRAFVSGYVKKSVADVIFKHFEKDPVFVKHRTIVTLSCNPEDIKYIDSLNKDSDDIKTISMYIKKKYNDSNFTYCGMSVIKEDECTSILGNITDKENYVMIELASKCFDDYNGLFWKKILKFFQELKQ
jgi:hypothetical protein